MSLGCVREQVSQTRNDFMYRSWMPLGSRIERLLRLFKVSHFVCEIYKRPRVYLEPAPMHVALCHNPELGLGEALVALPPSFALPAGLKQGEPARSHCCEWGHRASAWGRGGCGTALGSIGGMASGHRGHCSGPCLTLRAVGQGAVPSHRLELS